MCDQARRDAIIGRDSGWFKRDVPDDAEDFFCGTEPCYAGGIALFSYMRPETLRMLVNEGFADLEDRQNEAPTLGEFLRFLEATPGFTANGYVICGERNDCRVTITGLDFRGRPSDEQLKAFNIFGESASERDVTDKRLFCWWD